MDKDLISVCQMFLVPASILFTALGAARTEGLKVGVSFLGVAISYLWFDTLSHWVPNSGGTNTGLPTAFNLCYIFGAVAAISLGAHLLYYFKLLKREAPRPDVPQTA